jgi:endonuclease-3
MPTTTEIKRARKILSILQKEYPVIKSALDYNSPFELLISTILSAQCTDARVNIVTKTLFKKYKKPAEYINVPDEELQKDIYSTGFYKQKTKSIKNCCTVLIEVYNGKVPNDFNKLVKLPGVGRKTASVVAGNAFGIPSIPVDTHVKRLSNLLGFIKTNNVDRIEERLKELFLKKDWINLSHWIISHGRNICIARRPKCTACVIGNICPSFKEIEK